MSFSLSAYTKINVGWGFAADPTVLPQTSYWFQGGRFVAGGEWRGEEGRTRERGRGNGENEKRGKLGDSALVVGDDRRPWLDVAVVVVIR